MIIIVYIKWIITWMRKMKILMLVITTRPILVFTPTNSDDGMGRELIDILTQIFHFFITKK